MSRWERRFLNNFAEPDVESISPATARKLFGLSFAAPHHERVRTLSAKAQEGTLSPAERDELDEYIRVGTLLAILQSRARQVLKNAQQARSSATDCRPDGEPSSGPP